MVLAFGVTFHKLVRLHKLVPLLRSTLQDSALPYVALLDAPDIERRRLGRPRRRRALSRVCSPRYCALLGPDGPRMVLYGP
jgi:hypothetical protein